MAKPQKTPAKGISMPIAFGYDFRGHKYGEIEVYFSFDPISFEEIDLIEPGKFTSKKMLNYFLNKNSAGKFDYLIPYKITPSENYEAPWGMRFAIGLLDRNPTTSTMLNRIGLVTCQENNLDVFLGAFSPDFYLCVKNNRLFIRIKCGEKYNEIPSQEYSPNCWPGFAHPSILIEGQGTPHDYKDFDWKKIYEEIA